MGRLALVPSRREADNRLMKRGIMQPPPCRPSPPLMSAGRPPEHTRAVCAPDPQRSAPGVVVFLWCAALVLALVELAVHVTTSAHP
jgi:hypothetical protein